MDGTTSESGPISFRQSLSASMDALKRDYWLPPSVQKHEEEEIEARLARVAIHLIIDKDGTPVEIPRASAKDGFIFNAEPASKDLLEAPLPQGFYCSICDDILDDPYLVVPCGHVFCLLCIGDENRYEDYFKCPSCKERLSVEHPWVCARPFQSFLKKVMVRCENGMAYSAKKKNWNPVTNGGCQKTIRLSEASSHHDTCPFKLVQCTYSGDGCGAVVERQNLAAHKANCTFKSWKCGCGRRVKVSEKHEHLKEVLVAKDKWIQELKRIVLNLEHQLKVRGGVTRTDVGTPPENKKQVDEP